MIRVISLIGLLLLSACAGSEGRPTESTAIQPPKGFAPVTAVYDCVHSEGAFIVVTRTVPQGLGVFLPAAVGAPYQVMQETVAGSEYAGNGAKLLVSSNGLDLSIGDSLYTGCTYNRRASIWEHAKLEGVDFRAIGNEPGWHLEIRMQNRLDLTYDYGQAQLSASITETVSDAASQETRFIGVAGAEQLVVALSLARCQDTMSGEVFPTRVRIELNGRILEGCGRALH